MRHPGSLRSVWAALRAFFLRVRASGKALASTQLFVGTIRIEIVGVSRCGRQHSFRIAPQQWLTHRKASCTQLQLPCKNAVDAGAARRGYKCMAGPQRHGQNSECPGHVRGRACGGRARATPLPRAAPTTNRLYLWVVTVKRMRRSTASDWANMEHFAASTPGFRGTVSAESQGGQARAAAGHAGPELFDGARRGHGLVPRDGFICFRCIGCRG